MQLSRRMQRGKKKKGLLFRFISHYQSFSNTSEETGVINASVTIFFFNQNDSIFVCLDMGVGREIVEEDFICDISLGKRVFCLLFYFVLKTTDVWWNELGFDSEKT